MNVLSSNEVSSVQGGVCVVCWLNMLGFAGGIASIATQEGYAFVVSRPELVGMASSALMATFTFPIACAWGRAQATEINVNSDSLQSHTQS